jgi:hypothetical protein
MCDIDGHRGLFNRGKQDPPDGSTPLNPGGLTGALDRIRTYNLLIRSQVLYPLSYERN